jgi:hypothetical protein
MTDDEMKKNYFLFSVHLISSTPGRHTGPDINKFGHLKLRQVINDIQKCFFKLLFFRH